MYLPPQFEETRVDVLHDAHLGIRLASEATEGIALR
jgi:hypothetical protein